MGDPYFGQIDAFAVYCRQLDASFLIPIEDVQTRQIAALRVDTPANGQYERVRWALPYLLGQAGGRLGVPTDLERKTGFEPAIPPWQGDNSKRCGTSQGEENVQ